MAGLGRLSTPTHKTWIALEEIAPCMGVAVIAGEDQNFAEHFGFDWKAIEKAMAHNDGANASGRLHPQPADGQEPLLLGAPFLGPQGFEAYCTLLLELGGPSVAFWRSISTSWNSGWPLWRGSRVQAYFHKHARMLTASEAALLAAVLPNPHKFRVGRPQRLLRGRQAWILNQMRQLGGKRW